MSKANRSQSRRIAAAGLTATALIAAGAVGLPQLAAAAAPVVMNLGFTGGEQTYVVPAGIHAVDVVVNGASGGDIASSAATGGAGATVTTTLDVSPGDTLYVEIGGKGGPGNTDDPTLSPHTGGYNGGGKADTGNGGADGSGGAGGGGATDIRYCSITSVTCDAGVDSASSRVVVAGGGGGAGDVGRIGPTTRIVGGNGGAAGQPGTMGTDAVTNTNTEHGGNFGTAATTGHAGVGGAVQHADPSDLVKIDGDAGGDGDAAGRGLGGVAGPLDNGGGGGGGFRGGGAGGGGSSDNQSVHGGGGGGGGGASTGGTISAGPADSNGSATITTVPTLAPVATFGSATATSTSTATLTGTVDSLGYPVSSCAFAYGLTTRLGSTATCAQAASSISNQSTPTPVSTSLTDLKPGTTYYVALAANGDGGLGVSQRMSFTTTVAKPVVGKTKASAIKPTSAKLSASVYSGGGLTKVVFVYGTTKRYGKHSKTITIKAGKTVAGSVKAAISKLKPQKKYHVRTVVTNSAGSVKSADFTFTTKKKRAKRK